MRRGFHADLDQLLDVVDRLAVEHTELEALAARLERELGLLHDTWDGAAAAAHVVAQGRWDEGFAAMRAALADMRAAADAARDNYTGAAETNAAMWGRLG